MQKKNHSTYGVTLVQRRNPCDAQVSAQDGQVGNLKRAPLYFHKMAEVTPDDSEGELKESSPSPTANILQCIWGIDVSQSTVTWGNTGGAEANRSSRFSGTALPPLLTWVVLEGLGLPIFGRCDQFPNETLDLLVPLVMLDTVYQQGPANHLHVLLIQMPLESPMSQDVLPPAPAESGNTEGRWREEGPRVPSTLQDKREPRVLLVLCWVY